MWLVQIILEFRRVLRNAWAWLFRPFAPRSVSPRVDGFSPHEGWPGTVVTILGRRFAAARDENTVMIGGDRALILSASVSELRAVAGENTGTGPVEVVTSRGRGASVNDFSVLPWPNDTDFNSPGAPLFFHGPQAGTPEVGVANQPVLVTMAYSTDHEFENDAQRTGVRNSQIQKFQKVQEFWDQATYGATTWNFSFTDWLPLPQDDNFYFWTDALIEDARLTFLRLTKRTAVIRGDTIYATQQNALVALNVSDPASPATGSAATLGQPLTGLAVRGDRAYVTAGDDGLHVFDVMPATPRTVTNIPTTGWYEDVDVDGNFCAVAALGNGVRVFDLADPDNPVFLTEFATLQNATAVRMTGTRLYVGAENFLRVLDLDVPGVRLMQFDVAILDTWVTGLAAEGDICAVATFGSGVRLFDASGPGLTEMSTILDVIETYDVAIQGNVLCIAGDQGVVLYDISNPAAPVLRSTQLTTPAAFGVTLSLPYAYLSLGTRALAVVDISDPAAPSLIGDVTLAGPTSGAELDLSFLRSEIESAIDQQGLAIGQRVYVDALQAAERAGFNLNDYSGFVVVLNGTRVRASAPLYDQVGYEDTTVRFNETKGLYYTSTGDSWWTAAHEHVHWFGMWDIYAEAYADGTLLEGSAGPWCMSGQSGMVPLFCAHQIQEILEVYRDASPNPKVATRTWSPTAPALDETFEIVAHDAAENTDAGRIHVLRLVVSSGLSYYVEVRQKPDGRSFDQEIPVTNAVDGAVVVTRVMDGTSISNTLERPIMLFGVLETGQDVVDAARGLTIRAARILQDRPLVYEVRVTWNQPVVGDLAGQFDLAITRWTTDHYESVDIWVDSPRNNSGSTIVYENHEPGDTSKPILNGDRPWVGRNNQIYARIRNTGPMPVGDVYVTFYVNSPPGIGDSGDWATLDTKHVPILPGHDPDVPGSGEAVVSCDWRPRVGEHTCLKVAVLPREGEINVDNNAAQENVFTFDSGGGSSHEPVVLETKVRSPFTVWKRVDARVSGLPPGWHAVVNHAWVWTSPNGTEDLEVIMWTDLNAPYDFTPHEIRQTYSGNWKVPPRAFIRVEGWTYFDHRYVPIGGILADIKANRKVEIDFATNTQGEWLFVRGYVTPPLAGVPITVEIKDERGTPVYLYGQTNARGTFDMSTDERARVGQGVYDVQAFVTAGGAAAETDSVVRRVAVEPR